MVVLTKQFLIYGINRISFIKSHLFFENKMVSFRRVIVGSKRKRERLGFSEKTKKIRHSIVKAVAPKLWEEYKVHVGLERPFVDFLQNNFKTAVTGVEIGVSEGINAEHMLKVLNIEKLYLVDPYSAYDDGFARTSSHLCEREEQAKKRLKKFGDKIQFIRLGSSDAAPHVPGNLDFAYIDGNHTYEYIKQDIADYYPKVKDGGVLGGHDFSGYFPDVPKAVIEFAEKMNLKLYSEFYDWWIVKPTKQ
jgi:hypothetical protein